MIFITDTNVKKYGIQFLVRSGIQLIDNFIAYLFSCIKVKIKLIIDNVGRASIIKCVVSYFLDENKL